MPACCMLDRLMVVVVAAGDKDGDAAQCNIWKKCILCHGAIFEDYLSRHPNDGERIVFGKKIGCKK